MGGGVPITGILRLIQDRLFSGYIRALVAEEMRTYLKQRSLCEYSVFGDESRLEIAPTAVVNNALFNLSSGGVRVEDCAFFGHNVSLLTGTHDVCKLNEERQRAVPSSGRDIVIGRGAWVASNATILGPCVIGEHAVVAACSLVSEDVPPYTIVSGAPARVVSTIDERCANRASDPTG
jgi:acetyltransferase-like isoleucine patch superfamily enzyme